jgi:hypothetical protein
VVVEVEAHYCPYFVMVTTIISCHPFDNTIDVLAALVCINKFN